MSNSFLLGAIAMSSLVASLFFLRYWRRTHDRFFLLFALAFAIDVLSRIGIDWYATRYDEHEPLFYLARMAMFGLIVVAIVDKNTRVRHDGPPRTPAP
jgi:RsiW-degrading membrane proteinase PrsW (M82 family)